MKLNEYLDESAAFFLDMNYLITEKIDLKTSYGRRHLENRDVFVSGCEKEFELHFRRLEKYDADFSDSLEELRSMLSKIRNIDESISKIENSHNVTIVDLFEIKRFVYFHEKLLKKICVYGSFELSGMESLESVWNILDPKNTGRYFFSIDSEYADHLREEYSKIVKKQNKEMESLCERLSSIYELPLDGRREFILKRGDLRNGVLSSSNSFMIIKESAFSIQYRVKGNEIYYALEKEKQDLEIEIKNEEIRYIRELSDSISPYLNLIGKQTECIGEFDFSLACLQFRKKYVGCFPNISETGLEFVNSVYVKIKEKCETEGKRYDTISAGFSGGVSLIVGSNMGGKTSALKTIGQNVVLGSLGIPCVSDSFSMTLFDRINTVFRGKEEDGLSGFGSEVKRAACCFENGKKLNLIDEFGSGTNPKEGESLAVAFMKYLNTSCDSCSIFVTHFPASLNYSDNIYYTGLFRENMEKSMDSIYESIDHSLVKSDGKGEFPFAALEVARLLGFPECIIEEARKNIS